MAPPDDKIEILYSADQISARIAELAAKITGRMGRDIMVVAVLKGSFIFAADLLRALHHQGAHPRVDFMSLSSYGAGTESSGQVEVVRDITDDVVGRNVLLIDDILESGRTLNFARELLAKRGANEVRIAVLLDKPGKRKADIEADFIGFTTPDLFVVGYGLDYAHYYRELPYIGVIVTD